jgi:trk system potassium uptake protein TrkH
MYNNNFMDFSTNIPVNITVAALCYLGAVGFIVLQDLYYNFKRKKTITFTSKVILYMTLIIFILGTAFFYFTEPSIQTMNAGDRLIVSAFQVMSASTTAGFNSIDMSILGRAALFLIIIVMIIGASPSGTGGGIKTTSVSALSGTVMSIIKKRDSVVFMNHEIPLNRVFYAVAATTVYITVLSIGMFFLTITDVFEFERLFFEAASALGTVGLSTGITSSLSYAGKVIIILLMYIGRIGPLSLGISLFGIRKEKKRLKIFYQKDDLAV